VNPQYPPQGQPPRPNYPPQQGPRQTGQYPTPPYDPNPPVPRQRFDPLTLAILAAAGLAGCACCAAVALFVILTILPTPQPPATARPTLNLTIVAANAAGTRTFIAPTIKPTFNPASVGKLINPSISANLGGMSVLQIDVLDQASGNYTRAAQLTGADLDIFAESFNISVPTTAPNTDCPDHVRLSVTRADNSVVTIGVCLKSVVILRGLPDLGGADAPMGPRFSDAISPYLPDAYRRLLRF